MKFLSRTQRDYEEEAERLVGVLRRWHDLENQVKRLEWQLDRCRHPEASRRAAPPLAEKPAALRRSDEGKPLVPATKQGRRQTWTERYQKVKTDREYYEQDVRRLASRVHQLTMQVSDCKASREQGRPGPAAEDGDPVIDRVRRALEREQAPEHRATEALLPPPEADQGRRAVRLWQDQKDALQQRLAALTDQVDSLTRHLDRKEKTIETLHAAVAAGKAREDGYLKRFAAMERVKELAGRFLQGQRSFLFVHNDPPLENALAGLIDYALARLALALAAADTLGVLAMCANLQAVATRLHTYKGTPVHGLEEALEVLRALQAAARDEEAAGQARRLPPAAERQGPEAKPFLVRLKYLRDVARLDLRPFYFFDDQDRIQCIG